MNYSLKLFIMYSILAFMIMLSMICRLFSLIDLEILSIIASIIYICIISMLDINTGFNLIIMTMPFKGILGSYEIGIITLDVFTGGIIFLFAMCIIKLLIGQINIKVILPDIFIIAFAIFALSFFFLSSNLIKSGYSYFHTIFIPLITYLVTRSLLTDHKKYKLFKKHLVISILVFALIFIGNFLNTHLRASTSAFNSLTASIYFFFALLIIDKGTVSNNIIKKFILLFSFIICFSRNYLVNVCLSPIYYKIIKREKIMLLFSFFIIMTFITTFVLSAVNFQEYYKASRISLDKKYYTEEKRKELDTYQRLTNLDHWKVSLFGLSTMWQAEMKKFYENPIWGIGIGNSLVKAASSHNIHLQLLTFTGIIGYILFHGFILSSVKVQFMNINEAWKKEYSVLILLVLLIYLNGFTNGLFHGDFNYFLFLILALINNIHKYLKI